MNFKVAMATKDPTYRLPNYTLPSISDYNFLGKNNKNKKIMNEDEQIVWGQPVSF